MHKELLQNENYKPGALFDDLIDRLHVRNDSQLARALQMTPPAICKIRKKQAPLTGDVLLRIQDLTGYHADDLRALAGIPKAQKKSPVVPQEAAHV